MNTEEFISTFRDSDIRLLALQGAKYPDVDMAFALDQIAGRQIAVKKLPSWAEIDRIIYPPHISMEQCSSERTALYKQKLAESLIDEYGVGTSFMIDLTGGFGVDFSFLARNFKKAVYVERQAHLCDIAKRNFSLLNLSHAEVVCDDGITYLQLMKPCDFVYLDPARRNENGGRTYAISDCLPDVSEINDLLLSKLQSTPESSGIVMLKLSPMLDWRKAVVQLYGVSEVHIISVNNECKELLIILSNHPPCEDSIKVTCVNNEHSLSYTIKEENNTSVHIASVGQLLPGIFLFEPNASIMKAGCFGVICEKWNIEKISKNSNLYISSDETEDFHGRRFLIEAVSSMNKRELRNSFQGIKKANIAVRNFPLTAQELRKRLKLADGGDTYIFGTTDSQERHVLLICRKL